MKKQELIHLHGLLAEVGNDFEQREGVSLDLSEYQSLGIRPTSIHQSKTDHKAAVFALSDCLIGAMRTTAEAGAVPAQAD